jgi:phage terminase small subunit
MTAGVRKVPKPPGHLSKEARRWWSGVMGDYLIEPHMVSIVTAAAESWDRKEAARKVLAVEGMTVDCRDGKKTHPCVGIERDSRLAYMRAVRELCLSAEDPDESRSPSLRYPGRRP